jgi:hypothetical protein
MHLHRAAPVVVSDGTVAGGGGSWAAVDPGVPLGPGLLSSGDCSMAPTQGENSSSTERWKDVPRGTMDEVSSYVCLDLPLH